MKIAIVTDSNSGITQKQAQELGVFVLAMPFQIDGETHYEDITLTQEEFESSGYQYDMAMARMKINGKGYKVLKKYYVS